MKNKLSFSLLLLVFISFYACKKDELKPDVASVESLTRAEEEILANSPNADDFNENTVVLPNGMTIKEYLLALDTAFYDDWLRGNPFDNLGPQDARNLLIARLNAVAFNLTDRSRHQHEAEGNGKPAQNGLAYSWGNKDYKVRRAGSNSANSTCDEEVYGLDCSGFMYQLFNKAGIDFPNVKADEQRKPATIQAAIQNSFSALNKVKVEDLGQIAISKIETGDIIYWTRGGGPAFHIGIVLTQNGKLAVFQSNGYEGEPGHEADCALNLLPNRGPRGFVLTEQNLNSFSPQWGVVRINAEISGKWVFHMRCEGYLEDAVIHDLDFPTGSDADFSITKNYTDYDGSSNQTVFNFSYSNVDNVLSCSFLTTEPGFERKDNFSVKLNRDDTGYVGCTNEYITGSGCGVEVRLENKE